MIRAALLALLLAGCATEAPLSCEPTDELIRFYAGPSSRAVRFRPVGCGTEWASGAAPASDVRDGVCR